MQVLPNVLQNYDPTSGTIYCDITRISFLRHPPLCNRSNSNTSSQFFMYSQNNYWPLRTSFARYFVPEEQKTGTTFISPLVQNCTNLRRLTKIFHRRHPKHLISIITSKSSELDLNGFLKLKSIPALITSDLQTRCIAPIYSKVRICTFADS